MRVEQKGCGEGEPATERGLYREIRSHDRIAWGSVFVMYFFIYLFSFFILYASTQPQYRGNTLEISPYTIFFAFPFLSNRLFLNPRFTFGIYLLFFLLRISFKGWSCMIRSPVDKPWRRITPPSPLFLVSSSAIAAWKISKFSFGLYEQSKGQAAKLNLVWSNKKLQCTGNISNSSLQIYILIHHIYCISNSDN